MRKKHLIILIIGLLFIFLAYLYSREEKLNQILLVSQTIFAFITLMIAIVLFDKYQAGNKLNNKTLDTVIEYIEFLQKTTIIAEFHKHGDNKIQMEGFSIIKIKSNQSNSILNINGYEDSPLFVNFISFLSFYNSINRFIESPWMPKVIRDASEFLNLKGSNTIYNPINLKEDCIILTFGISDSDNGLLVLEDAKKLDIFYNNITNLTETINSWIKSQASDINFYI